ncbi:MAG: hypothetical protein RTU92_08175 [Candidatus Thorarchaeota archaeon]
MLQFEDFLTNLAMDFIVAFVGTLCGIALKSFYDWMLARFRLRHMRNIFGTIDDLRGQVRFVIPRFKPLTYDDFAEGDKTFMVKDFITNKSGTKLDDRRVPMYSEVLVIDDYLAFRHIEDLFAEYGYGKIEFCADRHALPDWRKELIICFGGPRSNQKLRQILNQDSLQFFDIYDLGDLLSEWKLMFSVGKEEGTYNSSEEIAYAFILKAQNPFYPEGVIFGIAGDSASSTIMAARYVSENLVDISETFGDNNFLLVLQSSRDMYETVHPIVEISLEGITYVPPSAKS